MGIHLVMGLRTDISVDVLSTDLSVLVKVMAFWEVAFIYAACLILSKIINI